MGRIIPYIMENRKRLKPPAGIDLGKLEYFTNLLMSQQLLHQQVNMYLPRILYQYYGYYLPIIDVHELWVLFANYTMMGIMQHYLPRILWVLFTNNSTIIHYYTNIMAGWWF